ncbi:MAG: tRNA-intron lyase [Thermoproteota archaeon]
MSRDDESPATHSEARIKGVLGEDGVKITQQERIDELSNRGYGSIQDDQFILAFYEAMYLFDREIAEVKDLQGNVVDFKALLHRYETLEEGAWAKYLTFQDLRSRGYVVRGGFGWGIDFRVYERGKYQEKVAKYLVLSMQEGNPISLEDLTRVLNHCQSLKKELILAVMNRRGEIVYYRVSEMNLR